MGFFDRFKSKFEQAVKQRSVKAEKREPQPSRREAKSEASGQTVAETRDVRMASSAYRILARPVVTEKTTHLSAAGKYVFLVAPGVTKLEVKRAVEESYGVRPTDVNLMNVEGKRVRFGYRFGKRKDIRKAVVTMPAGKTLPIYE